VQPSAPAGLVEGSLAQALAPRDLTDPAQGPHAVQRLVEAASQALAREWGCAVEVHRGGPVVPVTDHVLRARAAAALLPLLDRPGAAPLLDVLLVCPALVHREGPAAPATHEVELWRVRRGAPLGVRDLARMVAVVARAIAPGRTLSAAEDAAPWLEGARRLDVRVRRTWIAAGRAGLVRPEVLAGAGLPADASALALTLELDRLVMIAKGLDDPALLHDARPEVAAQMLDLEPYLPGAVEGLPYSADSAA
jgi:phenylalanyl-tRNA synthetase alpha chain